MTISHHPPPAISALRLANRIHDQITPSTLRTANNLLYYLDRFSEHVEQLAALRRRINFCQHKGWQLALGHLMQQLRHLLTQVPADLRSVEQVIPRELNILSVAEIAKEFEQIDDEFGCWHYERSGILSVVTDPITLEDVHLGAFEIQLNIQRLGQSQYMYEVVALDPNPASSNESVTHPHVRDKELCEGDATLPIKAALSEGRLCDFFMLVRSVLQTYNRHSPHVSLASWSGHLCHDCNYLMEDESHYCDNCNHDFCDNCFSYCRSCDDSRCLNCLETCPHCDDSICGGCLKVCTECVKPCCSGCLDDGLCPECQELQNQPKETSHDHNPATLTVNASKTRYSQYAGDYAASGGYTSCDDRHECLSIRARRRRRHRTGRVAA